MMEANQPLSHASHQWSWMSPQEGFLTSAPCAHQQSSCQKLRGNLEFASHKRLTTSCQVAVYKSRGNANISVY